jgi:hypothetical protein
MSANRNLGDRHRVAITSWPITDDTCGRFSSAADLFDFAQLSGYDGLEMSVDDMKKAFYTGVPYVDVISDVRRHVARTGIAVIGALYFVSDGDWRREQVEGPASHADQRERKKVGLRDMVNGGCQGGADTAGRWDLDFEDADFEQVRPIPRRPAWTGAAVQLTTVRACRPFAKSWPWTSRWALSTSRFRSGSPLGT